MRRNDLIEAVAEAAKRALRDVGLQRPTDPTTDGETVLANALDALNAADDVSVACDNGSAPFIKPTPETTWPNPDWTVDAEWALRHTDGEPSRMVLASVLSAYRQLCLVPSSAKYLPKIRSARAAMRAMGVREEAQDE